MTKEQWDPIKVSLNDVRVVPTTREYPGFTVEHVIIKQNESLSRVVFHIKKLPQNMMEALSAFLHDEIAKIRTEYPESRMWGSVSPEFRGQWDMGLEYLDHCIAPLLRDRILHLLDMFSRSTQGNQAR